MKRYRIWMFAAFTIVTALLVSATIKTRQTSLWILSHQPRTPAYNRFIADVSSEMKTPMNAALIRISEPVDGDFKNVLEYRINPDGGFDLTKRDFSNSLGSFRGINSQNAVQLAKLKALIQQLPPSAPPAKREDFLVVLIYQPSPTQIWIYDRRNPPAPIREIVEIMASVIEKKLGTAYSSKFPKSQFPHLYSQLRPSNAQRAVN